MSNVRAVLWDMDGTLIDSEEFHWISWRDTMAKEGFPITHDQFIATFGQRDDSIIRGWLGAASPPAWVETIATKKEELYRHLIREHGISPLPGVVSWIHRLHEQGWLQAIASAAPRPNIDVALEALGFAHCFQAIVSADDVHRGKPDPEVYLLAASGLGAQPDRCIVVEDAVAGIEGTRRAGMRSIGVARTGTHLGADVVVQSLDCLDSDAFEILLQKAA